jgi:hypothetical protein
MDEITIYETSKQSGYENYQKDLEHRGPESKDGRSKHYYGKIDKLVRGIRRKADRHSHHRRRNAVRNVIAKGNISGTESLPPPSSTKSCGNSYGWSSSISNRKNISF